MLRNPSAGEFNDNPTSLTAKATAPAFPKSAKMQRDYPCEEVDSIYGYEG
jgi:hypothetical protein